MEKAVAIFVAVNFVVIGLSHILQREAWAEFFSLLESKGKSGAFMNGFLGLCMGSVIVAFHRVWTGMPSILTMIGCAYLLKSVVIFTFPDWGVRSMAKVQKAGRAKFVAAGFGMLTIAAALMFGVAKGYPVS